MSMVGSPARLVVRSAWLGLVALLATAPGVRAAGSDEATKFDCGFQALYVLLHLEGRPVSIERLESALPPRTARGYSMAELAAAAGTLGLRLEGVRFGKGDQALDRPAIAFLQDARGGHFAVLRPVGATGTMVQVIDPPHVPWITDYDRMLAAKPWTGRILLPRDPWPVRHAVPLILAACGAALLLGRWRRGHTATP